MSPLDGLTNTKAGAYRLGLIKKGEKNGTTPIDLDHFKIIIAEGKHKEALQKTMLDTYGSNTRELNVRFPSPVIQNFWDANLVCHKGGAMIAQAWTEKIGDETVAHWHYYQDPSSLEVLVRNGTPVGEEGRELMSKPIDVKKPIYHSAAGKPVLLAPQGRLEVVIPETAKITPGYFEFIPKSTRDIRNISAELAAYAETASILGRSLLGVSFKLFRREEMVTAKINGKHALKKSFPVHIEADPEWNKRALELIESMALPEIIDDEDEATETVAEVTTSPASDQKQEAKQAVDDEDIQIDPMSEKAVRFAAGQWGVSIATANEKLASMWVKKEITNPMVKREFKAAVNGR